MTSRLHSYLGFSKGLHLQREFSVLFFAVGKGLWRQVAVSVFYVPQVCVYLNTTALFPRPLAPGLYLLLSLTVMKPAFKEWGAGSEASQIRSAERLVG